MLAQHKEKKQFYAMKILDKQKVRTCAWLANNTCNCLVSSLRDTAMRLGSQRPLLVQGVAGHPGEQGGGPKKNNHKKKKWRAKEEERHKGSLTPPKTHLQLCIWVPSYYESNRPYLPISIEIR
jgi:hypothetical protein